MDRYFLSDMPTRGRVIGECRVHVGLRDEQICAVRLQVLLALFSVHGSGDTCRHFLISSPSANLMSKVVIEWWGGSY